VEAVSFFRAEQRSYYGEAAYNPFESPSMPLASLALDGVLGSSHNNDSGEPVDPLKGMAIPTAYRCLAIISTLVASLVLEEVQKDGDSLRWDVLDNLDSYTQFEIMELATLRLGGWGNFFGKKIWNGRTLRDILPYPPGDVKVIKVRGVKTYRILNRDEEGNLIPANAGKPQYTDIPDGPQCEVFHVPGMGWDGLQGVSPILLPAQTFGTALAADRLAARFYSKGQQLSGILKVKVPLSSQLQADAMRQSWRNSHGGVRNAGEIAILDAETDFQPITIAPDALQFLQSREWQAWEIAKQFGIPAWMIQPDTTYGPAMEQQWQGFVAMTLRSYTDRIEQRFTRDFGIRGKPLEFDLDRLLRGATTERYQAYGQAIGWGWMTPAEARKKERMKSRPGIDKFLTPQSMNGALADGPEAMGTPPLPSSQQQVNPDKPDDQEDDDAPPKKGKGKPQ
jgi:HK97 family phage portal protein